MFGIGLPELMMILVVALLSWDRNVCQKWRACSGASTQLRRASEEFQQTIRQDLAPLERQEEDINRINGGGAGTARTLC